jgi:hypothetical protein
MAKKKRRKKKQTAERNNKNIGFGILFLFMATANYIAGATGMMEATQTHWMSFAFFVVVGLICLAKGLVPSI